MINQPSDMNRALHIVLPDAAATERAGASIASELRGGSVVTLEGELGTGKTTLVRAALRAAGVQGSVKSPTYALVEHYTVSSLYFYHFDFYRFTNPDEWEHTGFAEYFRDDSVCLIEWPARVARLLPTADLELTLQHLPHGRALHARSHGDAGSRCLAALRHAFPDHRDR